MMKIVIAGTNGLAQFIAYYLSQLTSHAFVFLTRTSDPGLRERNWQVLVVAYENASALTYFLRGVDLVISTVNGEPQLALLEAAVAAQVRHFIPSGFSGPEQCAPQGTVKTDWQDLMARLEWHEARSLLRYTVFTCGAFFENFGPGGLNRWHISSFNNKHASMGEEGDLLIDYRAGTAVVPVVAHGDEVSICMTGARDVARYVVAALQVCEDLNLWPREFKFCTERFTITELLALCSRVRGGQLAIAEYTNSSKLKHALDDAEQTLQPSLNNSRSLSIARMLAVAEQHPAITFLSSEINLSSEVLAFAQIPDSDSAPSEQFEEWLSQAWSRPTVPTLSQRASASTSGRTSGVSSRSSQKSKRPTPQ